MSTQQPPGGSSEGGYAQPQDPWGGTFEPGVASVPTDPIPQQYDPYPAAGPGEVWVQPAQGSAGAGYPQRSSSVGRTLGLGALVLALAGGAGYGAYAIIGDGAGGNGASPTTPAVTSTSATPTRVAFVPAEAAIDQCIYNYGSNKDPDLALVACSLTKSYKIIKVVRGPSIPETPNGKFGDESAVVCNDTEFQSWYGYQDPVSDTRDVFLCLTKNP